MGSGAIWLGRGAPKRWFRTGGGFQVSNAPTRYGRLSYQVVVTDATVSYHVTVPNGAGSNSLWKLRWPLGASDIECKGCKVAEVAPNGIATIIAASAGAVFTATADSA